MAGQFPLVSVIKFLGFDNSAEPAGFARYIRVFVATTTETFHSVLSLFTTSHI